MNPCRPLAYLGVLSIAVLAALAPTTQAADGVLELHQACIATGCFPGDPPGFPVEITESGSYVLTSNVEVPGEGTFGIFVSVDNVDIDLGGFTLSGPTRCGAGPPEPCGPVGSGRGVTGSNFQGISVRNGTIRGFGSGATFLGRASRVENVIAMDHGEVGIELQFGGIVRDCISRNNGGPGIKVGSPGSVLASQSYSNRGAGIEAGTWATVRGNSVAGNLEDGIRIGPSATVIGNVSSDNVGAGIASTSSPASGYAQNTLNNNADGTAANQVSGPLTQTGTNVCQGAPCP